MQRIIQVQEFNVEFSGFAYDDKNVAYQMILIAKFDECNKFINKKCFYVKADKDFNKKKLLISQLSNLENVRNLYYNYPNYSRFEIEIEVTLRKIK